MTSFDFITSSYLQIILSPLDLVYRIWYATFAWRLWRFWLDNDPSYNFEINFISPNAYSWLEVLAQSMILGINQLREDGQSNLFLPWNWTSQPWEGFFRTSSCDSTQINYLTKEQLVNKALRIDVSMLISAQGVADEIDYPHLNRSFDSPNDDKNVYTCWTPIGCGYRRNGVATSWTLVKKISSWASKAANMFKGSISVDFMLSAARIKKQFRSMRHHKKWHSFIDNLGNPWLLFNHTLLLKRNLNLHFLALCLMLQFS